MRTSSPFRRVRRASDDVAADPTDPELVPARSGDGTAVLTVFLVLLLAIPSQLVVVSVGSAGTPAQIYGVLLFLWWACSRLMGRTRRGGSRELRIVLALFAVSILVSYVIATTRPIEAVELRSADRGLISLVAWIGVALVAADGITTRDRLETLLRRLSWGSGLLAVLALLQFFSGKAIIDVIEIPGLSANSDLVGAISREGFTRAAATAAHPIEFGVVMTMTLPLALHFALLDTERAAWRRWWPVLAISLALLLSLSRSAILGAIVAVVIVLTGWAGPQRRRAYAAIALLVLGVYVAIPGMLGTLTRLFTGISDDGSALSRTDSYSLAWDFISGAPVFGRGFMTFLPSYRILDNAYLGTLIELGFVGLLATLALLLVAMRTAWRCRTAVAARDRSMSRALTASIAAGAVNFATFDAFGFPQVPGVLFLLIGASAALVATVPPSPPSTASADPTTAQVTN